MTKILACLLSFVILLAFGHVVIQWFEVPAIESNLETGSTMRPGLPPDMLLEGWRRVEDLPCAIAQFKTVFWDPQDTVSLRRLIRETALVDGRSVLEIGTGTGLLSLCCLKAGAARVVATDVNSSAIANATYNAEVLGVADRLEPRLVPLDRADAFSVIRGSERFDLIISNPPWEDQAPGRINEYALYDEHFVLLRSMLQGLSQHLKPGGKALLAYGCRDAIETLQRVAAEADLAIRRLDDRHLEDLSEVFLPGMLFEVAPRSDAVGL